MLTESEIQDLIRLPKIIKSKSPVEGYRNENGHIRCNLDLEAISDTGTRFHVFVRQNERFIENFSIGLRYLTGGKTPSIITLVRYNGPHGERSRVVNDHYAKAHIHHITAAEIELGSAQPQERHRELTDRYSTFEQGLGVFFADIETTNHYEFFPEIMQGRLL